MRSSTLVCLLGAMVLALVTLPLLFFSLPVGLACGCGSLLLALLAIPDLVNTEQQADTSTAPASR